jgi:hypothetical protein
MDSQNGHAEGICNMDMQHEQAEWRRRHGTWTWSMEMQHGHTLLACKAKMQNMDMHDGRAAWKCTIDMQQYERVAAWNAAWACQCRMPSLHVHAACLRCLSMLLVHHTCSFCMSISACKCCSSVQDFFSQQNSQFLCYSANLAD